MNKIIPVGLIIICLVGTLTFIIAENRIDKPLGKTNWEGLVRLGLAPSEPSRQVISSDKDTGLRINYNNATLALIEDNKFPNNGKTFLVRTK